MKKEKSQQEELKAARVRLDVTTAELARALGKSEATLLAWLAPDKSLKHRNMPESAKLLLRHVLQAYKVKK